MDSDERERWRGKVDAKIEEYDARYIAHGLRIDAVDAVQRILELKVNTIATKIGLFSAAGAFLGGGIMSLVVGFFVGR